MLKLTLLDIKTITRFLNLDDLRKVAYSYKYITKGGAHAKISAKRERTGVFSDAEA